jgi:hypothetical protein
MQHAQTQPRINGFSEGLMLLLLVLHSNLSRGLRHGQLPSSPPSSPLALLESSRPELVMRLLPAAQLSLYEGKCFFSPNPSTNNMEGHQESIEEGQPSSKRRHRAGFEPPKATDLSILQAPCLGSAAPGIIRRWPILLE